MTLLDAYALVAFLGNEPARPRVREILRSGETAMTAINLAEALDVVERVHGISLGESRAVVTALEREVRVLPVREADAWKAAELRAKYYDRRVRAISIADCVLVGASSPADVIATSDGGVISVARAEGIGVIPLLDSSGRHPAA